MKSDLTYKLTDLFIRDEFGFVVDHSVIVHFFVGDNKRPLGVRILKVIEERIDVLGFELNLN